MNNRFFEKVLDNRLLVILFVILLSGAGVMALQSLLVDALPDVSPVSVTILTEAPGIAPSEVEKQITNTIEMEMNGLPGVVLTRSKTLFGLSSVTVVFRNNVDIYRARTLVMERLSESRSSLPPGQKNHK